MNIKGQRGVHNHLNRMFVPNTVTNSEWKQVIVVVFLGAAVPPAAGAVWVMRFLSRCDEKSTNTLPAEHPPCNWAHYPPLKFTIFLPNFLWDTTIRFPLPLIYVELVSLISWKALYILEITLSSQSVCYALIQTFNKLFSNAVLLCNIKLLIWCHTWKVWRSHCYLIHVVFSVLESQQYHMRRCCLA